MKFLMIKHKKASNSHSLILREKKDNYLSYGKLNAHSERLCLAHKMRDLNYAIECDNSKLAKDIRSLLKEAMREHKESFNFARRVNLGEGYDESLE